MKKLFFVFISLFCICFTGCQKTVPVKHMEEKEKSYGVDIVFYQFEPGVSSAMTVYTLIKPDFMQTPTFYIKHFPSSSMNADKVQKFENAVVGEIFKENGKLKSIVINNVKYVNVE